MVRGAVWHTFFRKKSKGGTEKSKWGTEKSKGGTFFSNSLKNRPCRISTVTPEKVKFFLHFPPDQYIYILS